MTRLCGLQGVWLLCVLLLAGCGTTRQCNDLTAPYQRAQDKPALQTPADLMSPDHTDAFVIPVVEDAADSPVVGCLERPPAYFGTGNRLAASPEEMLADWAQAWADRNNEIVMAMYAQEFTATAETEGGFLLAQRAQDIATGPLPKARLEKLKVTPMDNDQQLASFIQRFGKQAVHKELTLIREGGVWKILKERVVTAQ